MSDKEPRQALTSEIDETTYLLRSPAMKKRLLEALKNMREGKNLVERELIQVEDEI